MPTFLRISPSWRSLIPIMFWPWIQISPASGCIKPTICFNKTLLPPPLRPIIARVSPVMTSRSTPRKISCCPILFANARTAIIGEDLLATKRGLMEGSRDGGASIIATHKLTTHNSQLSIHYSNALSLHSLIPRRVNDVERHGEEKIADQNRERGVHHRFSRGPADAHRAFACGQSFVATDEHDEYSKTERF